MFGGWSGVMTCPRCVKGFGGLSLNEDFLGVLAEMSVLPRMECWHPHVRRREACDCRRWTLTPSSCRQSVLEARPPSPHRTDLWEKNTDTPSPLQSVFIPG
ncbi:hypothetical protein E2C01_013026 [Portunus trituberculatus]|uniref:Uncharacterized protein n=1 Tax=Portunus trituberculatus TaxID=210409 RepID=A0A5B7DFW5_PORTR|nr:hypothetical protein [Portunus trituberculatus]